MECHNALSFQNVFIAHPLPQPPATTSLLWVSGFTCSGHFGSMGSSTPWPFLCGLFHSASGARGSSTR